MDIARSLRGTVSQGIDVATGLPTGVARAIGRFPAVVEGLADVVVRLNELITRFEQTEQLLRLTVERAAASVAQAAAITDVVELTAGRVAGLAQEYVAPLSALQPAVAQLADSAQSPAQDGLAVLLTEGRQLLQRLNRDQPQLMDNLQTVGPDLHELVAVSRALNEIIGSVPGMGRAKKKADETLEEERE